MRSLRPLVINAKLVYLKWAAREMHPCHPDYPEVILTIARLEAERSQRDGS